MEPPSKYKINGIVCLTKRYSLIILEKDESVRNGGCIHISRFRRKEIEEMAQRIYQRMNDKLIDVTADLLVCPDMIKAILLKESIWLPNRWDKCWDFDNGAWFEPDPLAEPITEDTLDSEFAKYQLLSNKRDVEKDGLKTAGSIGAAIHL